MSNVLKRVVSTTAALVLAAASGIVPTGNNDNSVIAQAKYGTGKNVVENLNRGISAINTGKGMLVSWRFLANDSDNAEYKLYRDGTLIYTSKAGEATCYLDKSGGSNSKYKVEYISGGKVVSSENCNFTSYKAVSSVL